MGERSTIIVYLITDALSILCIARLFRYYAAEKPLFLKELAAYAIYYLITNAVYLAFGIPILNMVMNLTGLFLLTRLYEKKTEKEYPDGCTDLCGYDSMRNDRYVGV